MADNPVPDPMTAPALRWGILAPGGIAHKFASAVNDLTASTVVAVGSRSKQRADEFAGRHNVPRAYGSYEELVADPEVDVVYVSSPHSRHRDHAVLALQAGKPVLVEKALARNGAEVDDIFAAAGQQSLFAMEAMWTRHLPHMAVIHRWIEEGRLGEIISVTADHGQQLDFEPQHRLKDPNLAGGALLDLGVYPLSFVLDFLGRPHGQQATGHLTETGVDASVTAELQYPDPLIAQISTTLKTVTPCVAAICGTKARVEISAPFYNSTLVRLLDAGSAPDGGGGGAELDRFDGRDIPNGFQYQAAETCRCVAEGRTESDRMSWQGSRDVMAVMDAIRGDLGVRYPGE